MRHATTMPLAPPSPLSLPPSSLPPSSPLPMPLLYEVPLPALSCSSPVSPSPPTSPVYEVPPLPAQSRPSPVLPPPTLNRPSPVSQPDLLPPLTSPVYEVPLPPAQSRPSPVLPPPSPPLSSPLPMPLVHELLPTPSSIATALLDPSEATEAKTNSRRAQEQADISSIGNGDANPLTKPQTQAPRNSDDNPNSDIKDKTACDDSTGDNDNSTSGSTHTYPRGSSFNDCKLVHDPGGSTFNLNIKDGSTHDNSDGTNSSSTSSDLSYIIDTQHSYVHDRDKTTFTASDADHHPPIDFVQATSPVPDVITLCSTDNFPAIFYDSSTRTDEVQHPLRHPAHLLESDLEFDHKQPIVTDFAHSPPLPRFSNNNNAISIRVVDTANAALTNATLVFNLATAVIASSALAIATLTIVIATTAHTSGLQALSHLRPLITDPSTLVCTLETSNDNSNSSSNDDSNIVNTICTLSTSDPDTGIDTITSKCPDAFNSGCTNTTSPISTAPSTIADNNGPKYERALTPPLNTSHQVPLIAAPQLDKPEEPPPVLPTNTASFAPDSQVVQDHPDATNNCISAQPRELKDERHKLSKPRTQHMTTTSMTVPFGNPSPLPPKQRASCLHPFFLHDGGPDTPCLPAASAQPRSRTHLARRSDSSSHEKRLDRGWSKFQPPGRCRADCAVGHRNLLLIITATLSALVDPISHPMQPHLRSQQWILYFMWLQCT